SAPVSAQLSDCFSYTVTRFETTALRRSRLEHLWRLVEKLPPQQRVAMTLRFRDDRSTREAAAIMGKSEAAVKLLIYRAVGRLRSQVGVLDDAPARSALAVS